MEEHGLILFHIPGIPDIITNTWIVMIILFVVGSIVAKRLSFIPEDKLTLFFEAVAKFVKGMVESNLAPEKAKKVFPFFLALFIFIAALNLWGLIPGAVQPTSSLNTTIGLAICAFIFYHILGIKYQGLKNYLKHFLGEPKWMAPIMLPIEIVSHLARIMSLSLRLFGNMFGDEMLVVVFMTLFPIALPLLGMAVVFGNSLLQAFIFVTLSIIYVALATHHGHHEKGKKEEEEEPVPDIDLA